MWRPGSERMGKSMMRLPLPISTCSTPVPTVCEKGRSPVRFCTVTAVGVSSCACANVSDAQLNSNRTRKRILSFMMIVLLELRIAQRHTHLNVRKNHILNFLAIQVVLDMEGHQHSAHTS